MPPRTAAPEPPVDPEAVAEPTPPAAEEEPSAPTREPGFFGWLRRLDLPRRPGWLGGVCAGIADRLGVDPILVRGVVVVIAVLGGPAALLYALAWFLLPDAGGTIHAEELRRGRVSRALPGIVAVFLLSFVPLAQGFWFTGAFYWGDPGWAGVVLRVLWTAALIVLAIVAVVWLARRASDVTTVPATTDDRPDTVPTFPAQATPALPAVAEPAVPSAVVDPPGAPPSPPVDASASELAAWREGQDQWQRQRSAWVAEQRRTEQERRRAEGRERQRVALAAARERERIDALTRPRASAGIVVLVLGPALIAAAVAAFLAQTDSATRGSEWLIGAAVLALVVGAGTVVVALARRRSGALGFIGILAILALAVAAVVPTDRVLLPFTAAFGLDRGIDGRYAQIAGNTEILVRDRDDRTAPLLDLWQYSGSIHLNLEEGASVRLEITTDAVEQGVSLFEHDGDGSFRVANYRVRGGGLVATLGGGEPDLVLRVWIGSGVSLSVDAMVPDGEPIPLTPAPDVRDHYGVDGLPIPTPSPATTEGVSP
jgi:phage shock protein PspC (stress-responsive transcriptional regulator)